VPASIPQSIYQLKVTLNGSGPPIWRRFLVPNSISLHQLHTIMQIAMGWTNSHLPQYIIEAEYYGGPEEEVEGYCDILEIFRTLEHPEHNDLVKEFGDDLDPEFFVIEDVNLGLRQYAAGHGRNSRL